MELMTVIKKNPKTSSFELYPKNPQSPPPQEHLLPSPDLQPHHARTISLTPLPESEFHFKPEFQSSQSPTAVYSLYWSENFNLEWQEQQQKGTKNPKQRQEWTRTKIHLR